MNFLFSPCLVVAVLLIVLASTGSLWHRSRGRARQWFTVPVSLHLGAGSVANVDENFVCATLDWWPPEKCDFGRCSWGRSSVLNLDLHHPQLVDAVKALFPLLIRIGGSLEDQVIYDVGNLSMPCLPFRTNSSRLGFSGGCLNMSRWQELNEFFQNTGSLVAFGLNSLNGRIYKNGQYSGPWNSSNARDFISYTVGQNYRIKAWQLGNEISGGAGLRIDPAQYALDAEELRAVLDKIYAGRDMPILVAPDGFFNYQWYDRFLHDTKAATAVSIHVYNLGPGNGKDLTSKILQGSYDPVYDKLQRVLRSHKTGARAWVGESGGAHSSGQHLVTDRFIFSFWYLDQLGTAALHSTAVFCRQALVGGNYGLLDASFNPNPDFYAALLWQKLMGHVVLNASSEMQDLHTYSQDLHTYSHCLKGNKAGGVTVLVINFSNTTEYAVNFPAAMTHLQRLEYHLSAPSGDLHSQSVQINGRTSSSKMSNGLDGLLAPLKLQGVQQTMVAPLSIAFVAVPDALHPACIL